MTTFLSQTLKKVLRAIPVSPLSCIFYNCSYADSSQNTIRIALLDSLYNEISLTPFLVSAYEKAYFSGVKTAIYTAKEYHLQIAYKPFIYGGGVIDALSEIPEIKVWNADLLIGLSTSDQFLMLKNCLPHTMILFPYASDVNLKSLPKNFYSTFLPDDKIMALLATYIHKTFAKKDIYIIAQIDSKQCVDTSNLFTVIYSKFSPKIKVTQNKTILDDINSINPKKLMAGHENDITFTDYTYHKLVKHISTGFPDKNLIFFSDQDNWNSDNHAYKKFDLPYASYQIGPTLFDHSSAEFREFEQAYEALYHTPSTDPISYITYITVMSAIEALHQFPSADPKLGMQEKILYSYLTALNKNPNWFRLLDYGIYRPNSHGEALVARLMNHNNYERYDKKFH